jgi:5-methylthioadenosine/S-adenosylhomocysteine deaminase
MSDLGTSNRTLFKGGLVLSLDPEVGDHERADVLVTADRITAVGPNLSAADARVIDAAGMIVMPGLINAHQHAWLGLLRGLMPNVDSIGDYMAAIPQTLGRFYTAEDSGLATRLTALSSLDAGVTTLLDACHNTRSPAHSEAAIAALEATGLRALHMVGKPLDCWPESWPGDVERLAFGCEAKGTLVRVGVFAARLDADQPAACPPIRPSHPHRVRRPRQRHHRDAREGSAWGGQHFQPLHAPH